MPRFSLQEYERLKSEEMIGAYYHHPSMIRIKEEMGDPKPPDKTLSLIDPVSPYTYWAEKGTIGMGRYSTDPGDYAWESQECNVRRNLRQTILLVKWGFLDEEGGRVMYRGPYYHPPYHEQ